MKLNAACIACMIKRQEEGISAIADEELKLRYFRQILKIIYDTCEDTSAPVVTERISAKRKEYFGEDKNFEKLKREYNAMLLDYEPQIEKTIENTRDPLLTALKFSRAGNYIDFGAMGTVDNEKLSALLESAAGEDVDIEEYGAFCDDLAKAGSAVICTDNCGEIVMDKLLVKQIQKRFPHVKVDVIVRGKPVLNDATMDDAVEIGLTDIAEVVGNGTGVAGTDLKSISSEAREKLERADVIISKGQGNFESLHGCGLNIYYLFLCKCDWFVRRFQMERYKGVFINEKNHQIK